MTQMIKRTFQKLGETKDRICVLIQGKNYTGVYEGWLPKNKIKITNRVYGWGGLKVVDIEFPSELSSLLKRTDTHDYKKADQEREEKLKQQK